MRTTFSSMRPRFPLPLATLALLYAAPLALLAASPPELPPLTTVSSPRLPGKFVWGDLVTDDVAAASAFYGGLFGWRFVDYQGYLIGLNDERPLCGMFKRERPKERQAQPRWFGYISVPDVKKARKFVAQAGGKVLAEPHQVPKRGEQAVFMDPEGAVFGVIRTSSGDPVDFLAEPGDWIWVQLLSRDGEKAAEFYSGVAGYNVIPNTTPNRVSDYVLSSKKYARATVRTIPKEHEAVKPNWLPFVRVRSVHESVGRAKDLGGKVLLEPKSDLLEGKAAIVADPTGAAVGLLEWEGLLEGAR